MPHGGGHAGGGGFGGGGHHHGGFHHHHHHHHHRRHGGFHHHRFHGGVVYTSTYGRASRWFWWGFFGFLVVAAVVTIIALTVRYGGEGGEENNYAPGDTRLHTISTFFCSSVQVKMTADSSQLGDINLYLLDTQPSLTAKNSFSISNSFTLDQNYYEYWHFYLYPNSNFSVHACVNSGSSSYHFYVIKGSNNFNKWTEYISSSYSEANLYVSPTCGSTNSTLSYTTQQEDHYYFAYDCNSPSCAGQLEIFLERFEYTLGNETGFANCTTTVTSDPCSLDVGYLSGYNQALVTTVEIPPNGNWEQQFTVEFSCGARVEAYLIVVLPPVVLVLIVLAGIALGCYLRIRCKRHAYNPIPPIVGSMMASSSVKPLADSEKVSYTAILEAERPPPYNPEPPSYQ